MGRDSSVSIATRYGLEGPGIEYRSGEIFRTSPYRPGANPTSCTMGTGFLSWGKAAGPWRLQPTPSSAEVKERVELDLYSPLELRGLFCLA